MTATVLVALLLASAVAGGTPKADCTVAERSGLPGWFRTWFEANRRATHRISCHLNPFYLRGNFDGRGPLDLAVLVVEKNSGKLGVLVVHRPGLASFVLGAGTEMGNGGDDYEWLDVWYVGAAPRSHGFLGEVLVLGRFESSSGWVGWNGREYVWVPRDD